uniref:GS catalytic domain-containing protein n=2 Tax=Florenciella parvula TaxID=236787 RepID=A0A7S2CDT9_9STRA
MPKMATRAMSIELMDTYGKHLFKGKVADEFLSKQGMSWAEMQTGDFTQDSEKADKVAAAVLEWAQSNGAHVYCHWFQPMAAAGVRHGQSGQVQNAMFAFDMETGEPKWDFKGKDLIKGETDGSSFPNGGLRATHTAGGYLAIDPSSPIFLRGDTIFLPSCFVSYYGHALDEKTPVHRSVQALSDQGKRLLKLLGHETEGLVANIGLEQEIFLIPRDAYHRRPDLQLTGRTIMGKDAPRGQEMCDHYMAPLNGNGPALAAMAEMQEECFRMGIPLKTRHREVAPNQFEFAPLFGTASTQIDQNLMVMQVIEEVAAKHGLAALLHEKPFNNVNGSGKHNNWSIATKEGAMVLNPASLNKATGNPEAFPIIMSAIVSAIDIHGDLMRMSISSPGNDFRLGACEAPPAIVSTYLGDDMSDYLDAFASGSAAEYNPGTKTFSFGVEGLGHLSAFTVPAEDRNRTSPFPYGGARFEYRAVGSTQNVSMVNTVLNTITADAFKTVADRIEAGENAADVARELYTKHKRAVFNGNGYDEAWPEEAGKRGIWRIDSGVDAIQVLTSDKNIKLFGEQNIFTEPELAARQEVLLDHYTGTVEMEALTMIDMIKQHVIPSVKESGVGPLAELEATLPVLEAAVAAIHAAETAEEKGALARVLRLETMIDIRDTCDAAEAVVPAEHWTLATYGDLLFMDMYPNPHDAF